MVIKYPLNIYCKNNLYYFILTYKTNNITCKNKWGFFSSNLIYDINEIPTIETNDFNNYVDNLYFYLDFFKNKKETDDTKIYTIHVKINKIILDFKQIKAIFINGNNKRIFAIGDINFEKKEVTIHNKSKTIEIISFV